jgi:hypothetical protein
MLEALLITYIHPEKSDQPHHPSKIIKYQKITPLSLPTVCDFPPYSCAHVCTTVLHTTCALMHNCLTYSRTWVHNCHSYRQRIPCTPICPTHTPTCVVVSRTTAHYVQVSSPQSCTPLCMTVMKKPHIMCRKLGYTHAHMCSIPPFPMHLRAPTLKNPCTTLHTTPTYNLSNSQNAG